MKKYLLNLNSAKKRYSLSALKSGFSKSLTLVLLLSTLTACGWNKSEPVIEASTDGISKDITQPPQTIVGREQTKVRDPEETISFDEWRKRRIEELKKEQTP